MNLEFSSDDDYDKQKLDQDIKINKHDSLIIMSFKLPIFVHRNPKTGEFEI